MADLSAPAPAPHTIDIWSDRLRADGYCIIPDVITPDCVAALNQAFDAWFADTPFCDGGFYGRRTKRFGGLLKHAGEVEALIRHPLILAIVERMLAPWCDRINLNLSQAIEIHPGAPAQFPHRDQDMWPGPKGEIEYLVNVMWPLTPFTRAEHAAQIVTRPDIDRAKLRGEIFPPAKVTGWLEQKSVGSRAVTIEMEDRAKPLAGGGRHAIQKAQQFSAAADDLLFECELTGGRHRNQALDHSARRIELIVAKRTDPDHAVDVDGVR